MVNTRLRSANRYQSTDLEHGKNPLRWVLKRFLAPIAALAMQPVDAPADQKSFCSAD
jgi:hypothetical protein